MFEQFFHEVNGPIWVLIGLVALRAIYSSIKKKDYPHAAAFVAVLVVAAYYCLALSCISSRKFRELFYFSKRLLISKSY